MCVYICPFFVLSVSFFFTFFPSATRCIYLYEFGHLLLKGRQEEEEEKNLF